MDFQEAEFWPPWRGRGDRHGRGRWVRGRGNYSQLPRQDQERGAECPQESDGLDGNSGRRTRNMFRRGRGGWGRGAREDTRSVSVDNWRTEARGQYHHGRRGPRGLRQDRGTGGRPRRIDLLCTTPLRQTNIQELSSLDFAVLVRRIDSQLKEFQQAIGDRAIVDSPETMDAIVQILTKLANIAGNKRDAEEQSTASKIMAEILSERSEQFHFQLNRVVKGCMRISQMEQFYELFSATLKTFPSLAWECLPIDELHETAKRAGVTNSKLLKDTNELCKIRDQIREAHSTNSNVPASSDDERDESAFRLIPLLPEWKEICRDNGIPPEVRPNKVEKGYKDWIQYYDIQFRLIREDFIAPLRRGVTAFLHGHRGKKNRDVKTYSGAKIMSQVTTKDKGICFNVEFDATGFRKVRYNWDHSKRLIFGSLLCFIPTVKTSEDDIIFATVTDRNSNDLMGGEFMVQFEGDILSAMTHCNRQTEFEIVESNSYFEATRPILRSIQKAEVETMPFTRQLIEGKCDAVEPPAYLCAKEVPQVYDLSCLHGPLKKRRHKPPLKIEVLNKADWDKASDTELDTSQLHAIQTALTQGIAVIQGPPGTGKTYIGLKIVESLLTNRSVWDPRRSSPILVMCYTNHALDQFLEGIIDTECCGRTLGVIRVGGRCKNEKVEEYNLNKVRRRAPRLHQEISREIYKLRKELEEWNPAEIWHKLNRYHHRKTLLPMNILRYLAHPDHVYQLTQMAKCAEHNGKELEVWLDLWKCEIKGKDNKNPPPQDLSKEKVEQGDQRKETQEQEEAKQKQTQEQEDAKQEEMEESGSRNDDEKIELEGEATIAQDERMDDDDVQGYQPAQLPKHNSSEVEGVSIVPHYTGNSSEDEADEDADGNKIKQVRIKTIWSRKRNAHILIKRNIFRNPMDDEEAAELENIDISSLSVKDRWRLYNYWAEKRFQYLQRLNREHVNEYIEKCRQLAELRQREDRYVLESADVIGMTTTGAAKYQHILHTIKPKIVIVEEAAEVLEAHVVSALNAGTQHLILIGDHKQLRPKPNEYVLATQYNLSISLFERLIRNKLPCATLEIQHRMRPEIARLVCPHVYDKLLNHESVEKYPSVQGISKNLFFINHTEPENEDQNLMSYQNDFEAKYIVSLCDHLLKLGYSPSQITILTPYVGQLLKLRDKMPRKQFEGVRVTAIDNFQGEENDIILFSMVRSTNPRSNKITIGFLKEDNRVCVSLSRAKHGFYAIGNFQLIRQQSVLWESIISDVEQRGCFGDALLLYCCNHPETTYVAKKESDFSANAPNGGCKKECDIRLPCGHSCTQKCHVVNREHIDIECLKPCQKKCPYNHPCKTKHPCFEKCPPCHEVVERVMPNCGHKQIMECYMDPPCRAVVVKIMPHCSHEQDMPCFADPRKMLCKAPCSRSCVNGHQCQKLCYEDCGECLIEVEKEIPICKHKQMVPCYRSPFSFKCQAPCPKLCQNGLHPCPKKCSEPCIKCEVVVSKTVPVCGHIQSIKCYKEADAAKCKAICEKLCPNELHSLKKKCCEKWPTCKSMMLKTLPECGHEILSQCFKDLSEIVCPFPCTKSCEKGHKCSKTCREECSPCLTMVTKTLDCGHKHAMLCSQACTQTFKCPTKCSKQLCVRGHECKQVCHYPQPCEPCTATVSIQIPQCSHEQSMPCFKSVNPKLYGYTCKHPCEKALECGHKCQKTCGENCSNLCTEEMIVELPCGHCTKIECYRKNKFVVNCKKLVSVKTSCGHTVKTECWKGKYKSVVQKECKKKCKKILKCGHVCQETCGATCTVQCKELVKKKRKLCGHELQCACFKVNEIELDPCTNKCRNKLPCGHPCKNRCGEPCSTCPQKSKHHYPCGHSRKIPCNSTIDEYPCQKKCEYVLSCGHCCSGKCGDCYSSRMHAICIFDVRVSRYCGHSETVPCAGLSDTHVCKQHTILCTHGEDYSSCQKVCMWDCEHIQCENRCNEECDRPPCDELCDKHLACGHRCHGICGERCPSVCWECDKKNFMKQFYPKKNNSRVPVNPPFFELSCGHIFTVQYLDEYMEAPNSTVMPKQCPRCHRLIGVGNRYGNAARRAMTEVEGVSGIVRENAIISAIERGELLSDRSAQTQRGIWRKLQSGAQVTNEEKCLVQCAISHTNMRACLQKFAEIGTDIHDLIRQLNNLMATLVTFAAKDLRVVPEFSRKQERQLPKVHLSLQLLDDFMSELYRTSLCALCIMIARKHLSIKETNCRTRLENSVERVSKYISALNPLKDRITKENYEHNFNQIAAIVPEFACLHVQTPQFPIVTKGTWIKCAAEHYYCVPPTCGSAAKQTAQCPKCNVVNY